MATVDDYKLRMGVEGTDKLDQLNTKLNQIQGGVRNTAYQIQDLAVQISNGTSVFIALGQQLPQLLSGFGTMGIVIGAVAAVTIPLLQVGLKAAGVDFRNLDERVKDLTDSTTKFQEAQRANMASVDGLASRFGSLSTEAKKFFDLQQAFAEQKALAEMSTALDKLKTQFDVTGKDIENILNNAQGITFEDAAMSAAVLSTSMALLSARTGLTADQVDRVATSLRNLDKDANPEQVAKAMTQILADLKEQGVEADKIRTVYKEFLQPVMDTANAAFKLKENLKAAGEDASKLSTELLNLQSRFQPDINAAKRNFDQIRAARLEGEQKVAEYILQANEKTAKDGVNRAAEIAAFQKRTQQDVADKVKDVGKAQNEAFRSIEQSNQGKVRQLDLESKILDIQDKGRLGMSYDVQYQQDIATNAKNYADTVANLGDQLRKNTITQGDYKKAIQDAADIQTRADANAEQARQKRIADLALQNMLQKDTLMNGLMAQTSALKNNLDLETKSIGLTSIQVERQRSINELNARRESQEQNILNNISLGEAEQISRLAIINSQYREQLKIIEDQAKFREKQQKDPIAGAAQRVKELQESFSNFKVGGMMVDSVFGNMSSAIDKFVETGKFKMSDFAQSVIMDLVKIQLKASATQILSASMGAFGITLPGKASGGPVDANSPYIVGESGPELFIPRNAGNIIPNGQLAGMRNGGGGGTTIINNISAVDAKSVARLFSENKMTLLGTVEQARRELPLRTR